MSSFAAGAGAGACTGAGFGLAVACCCSSTAAGQYVDVKFDIRGREYNGRWYTDIRLQFIKPAAVEEQQQATARPKPAERPATVDWTGAPAKKEDNPDEDLPF